MNGVVGGTLVIATSTSFLRESLCAIMVVLPTDIGTPLLPAMEVMVGASLVQLTLLPVPTV